MSISAALTKNMSSSGDVRRNRQTGVGLSGRIVRPAHRNLGVGGRYDYAKNREQVAPGAPTRRGTIVSCRNSLRPDPAGGTGDSTRVRRTDRTGGAHLPAYRRCSALGGDPRNHDPGDYELSRPGGFAGGSCRSHQGADVLQRGVEEHGDAVDEP